MHSRSLEFSGRLCSSIAKSCLSYVGLPTEGVDTEIRAKRFDNGFEPKRAGDDK
jgi:hypothetical protein